jgi:N utilization substance protein B
MRSADSVTEAKSGPKSHLDRSRARAWALQVLYLWDASGEDATPGSALRETLSRRLVGEARIPYLRRLVETFEDHADAIDARLSAGLSNWRLERLSAIDRAILRVATTEIDYFADVPPLVSIQEAVRLAEAYGSAESPAFVNGVLDGLYRSRPEERLDAP